MYTEIFISMSNLQNCNVNKMCCALCVYSISINGSISLFPTNLFVWRIPKIYYLGLTNWAIVKRLISFSRDIPYHRYRGNVDNLSDIPNKSSHNTYILVTRTRIYEKDILKKRCSLQWINSTVYCSSVYTFNG